MATGIQKNIKNLTDPKASKRRSAAEALSNADERAVYPLIKALRDENAGVHDAAMRSLISIGGETTAYMVLPLLREDALLRNTAMIILKEIGYVTIPLLRHLLKDKDDDVRKFAIDLIIDINHCDYLDDLITILNVDKNANVRASAAKALGIFQYEKAIPNLIKALNDDEWVAFSALEALALMKDESSIEPIASLLNSNSETLRYNAIEALGKIGIPSAEKYLIKHFLKTDGFEKTATLKSLLQIGVTPDIPEVRDILIDIYKNEEWSDRLIALRGLANLKDAMAIPLILDIAGSLDSSIPDEMDTLYRVKEILKDFDCVKSLIDILDNPNVKYRAKTIAIEIIEDQNCKEAVPYLIKLVEDKLRDVKRASMKALKELDAQSAEEIFLEACEDEDGHIRKYAISAIGRIGNKSVINKLFKFLNGEIYPDVKEDIVKAILAVDPQEAYKRIDSFDIQGRELVARYAEDLIILKILLKDANLSVRLSAINSLGTLSLAEAQETLIAELKDENIEIRKAALMALSNKRCCIYDILPMLSDNDMWVKIYAIKALGNTGNPNIIENLKPLLRANEIPIVLSAIDAIWKIAAENKIDISELFTPLLKHKVSAVRQKVQELEGIL